MFILEKPYVSDFLVQTIKKNNFKVLDNLVSEKYFDKNYLLDTTNAIKLLNENSDELVYSNSENSIDWVIKNLPDSKLSHMLSLSKDKIAFRNALKKIYPNYYFVDLTLPELLNYDPDKIKYPVVIKPSVGFLSFGVYTVKSKDDFRKTISNLQKNIEKIKNIFPKSVVDMNKFIIEQMIFGDEYAIDGYFDENNNATILNIFHHPFLDENDVSDRLYYTSIEIIKKYLEKFNDLLNKIGSNANYSNFPFHLELRVQNDEIIPIELNPMRFCGWCITDIAKNAWGINVYEYYMKKLKPNWDDILKKADESLYYFTITDINSKIDREKIKNIDYDSFLKNISNPLEVRKIDYKINPIYAIVFAKTKRYDEIKNILKLDTSKYIEM